MKIYLSGSHSNGKSTLAKYISDKYKLPFIPEVARMILSESEWQIDALRSDIDMANLYQQKIFYRQLLEEQKYTSFVSDRSVIDPLAYSAQHTQILSKLMKSKELTEYIASLKSKDAFVFFVRPSKATMKQDGVRETLSWDGIVAIDAMIKLLLEMFDIRYFDINNDCMQSRIRLVDSVLSLA